MKDEKTIKLRHAPDMRLTATVLFTSGLPVVEMRRDTAYDDGVDLTPTEARTLARALLKIADAADSKRAPRRALASRDGGK